MTGIRFTKVEAAKNDFVIVEAAACPIPLGMRSAFSRSVCERRTGVGADGTIFLERSATHDFRMVFLNPDGSSGSMCGNGGRAAALYAALRGLAGYRMRFESLGKTYEAEVEGEMVLLRFPGGADLRPDFPIDVDFLTSRPYFADTGAPHLVLFLDMFVGSPRSIEAFDMLTYARILRYAPETMPAGANVNVLQEMEDGKLRIRTFEKGVEGETLSCGTGTVASALIAYAARGYRPPITLRTQGGDVLTVDFDAGSPSTSDPGRWTRAREASSLTLRGPARLVFDGVISIEGFSASV
ncbi:MAG: diaminopimelate epimerase [Bacteroidota bacterium]|nr:diaminopimelate epimerase [Bacteroidota bacterium]